MTVSSVYSSSKDDLQKHVVEYDSYSYFYSKDVKDSWVKFDFKNKKVKLSHYSIKTKCFGGSGRTMVIHIGYTNDKYHLSNVAGLEIHLKAPLLMKSVKF